MSYECLRRKWFQGAGERQQEMEKDRNARAVWRAFIKTAGYTQLKYWIEEELERNEVQESGENSMTVQVGIRRGLRIVTAKLRDIERYATEEIHD